MFIMIFLKAKQPNIVSAVEIMNKSVEFSDIIHMRCSCHVFNLSEKDGLADNELKESLAKLRYFCKKIHASSKRQQDLKYKCEVNKEPQNKVVN